MEVKLKNLLKFLFAENELENETLPTLFLFWFILRERSHIM